MPAALQVYNSAGSIQIDSQFTNMVLVASGTTYLPAPVGPYQSTIIYGTGMTNPICVVTRRGSGSANCVSRAYGIDVENPGNPPRHSFFIYAATGPGVDAYVSWYIFDQQPNVPSNSGLTVYNPSGRVVFSSDYEPFRMIGITDIPYGTPDQGYGVGTYVISGSFSGQKLAVGMTSPKRYTTSDPYGSGYARQYLQNAVAYNLDPVPYVYTNGYDAVFTDTTANIGLTQPVGGQLIGVDVTNFYLP